MPLLLYICSKIESMLSIQLFRQEKELVLAGLQKKNFSNTALVDSIIEVDELRRTAQQENDALAAIVNAASKEIGALMGKGEKEAAEALKQQVAQHKDQAKAFFFICAARVYLLDSDIFLESRKPSVSKSGPKITAAA